MQSSAAFCFTAGKTELVKQLARYRHKDNDKVNDLSPKSLFLTVILNQTLIY